ncbi:sensor domain-containing protein [Mycobacterium aquaticum]|uniref:Nuclease PIN n=1 Tax=Mycobacterium aquaticum TaxID=1927124 RepID=A0A1X0B2K3_9MYCO|nr:sensor domain-containing protein [Mycobacterium aquaticum]ORA36308.1 hypothetical protein BST13_12225 [Mycobacterium aquaticum]
MTYPPPDDPFGGMPFGQLPSVPPPPYSGPPVIPAAPQPPSPSGEVNTFATLSVVFAFVFAPIGAVLGHLGLSQVKRTGQRGHDRALIGVALSYTFIVAAVVGLVVWIAMKPPASESKTVASQTTTTTTSAQTTTTSLPPPPPPPPPPVAPADMAGLLPSLDEMRQLMNNPDLTDAGNGDEVGVVSSSVQTFDPPECVVSMNSFTPEPYKDSGYRSVLSVNASGPHGNTQAGIGVAVFDDAAAAQKTLTNYIALLQQCAGKTLTWTIVQDGKWSKFILGAPENSGAVTGVHNTNIGSTTGIYRAIGAKSNVLVDVQMVGAGLTDQNIRAVNNVLDKIPG